MASCPAFEASTLGITNNESAYTCTPNFARPSTPLLFSLKCRLKPTSKAPAPGMIASSSMAFLTARKPSLTASLICSMVCLLGPFTRIVQECGCLHSSTKVYFSSPRVSSYTMPAHPRQSAVISSVEFMAIPPQAFASLSMFLRFALRRPRIPSLAIMSSESGSMPFWLMTTKVSPSLHTARLSAMICLTLSSTSFLSDSTSFSRWSALE
mmetsp:Transcript_16300/g.25304  ORF Transcript_16300/g.25304 Transcript_16300/m.25304 type:complete len:210 (+) Transcript_16300:233-862(+)